MSEQEEVVCLAGNGMNIYENSKPTYTVSSFNYSKDTPTNSATPFVAHFLSNLQKPLNFYP